jgi:hypothetical protein
MKGTAKMIRQIFKNQADSVKEFLLTKSRPINDLTSRRNNQPQPRIAKGGSVPVENIWWRKSPPSQTGSKPFDKTMKYIIILIFY